MKLYLLLVKHFSYKNALVAIFGLWLFLNMFTGSSNNCPDNQKLTVHLSKLLTKSAQKIGQLSCKIKEGVSENGGWCSTISGKNSSQHVTDRELAKEISTFLSGKSVASFGDGPGMYREIILGFNEVKKYDAFDGAPFAEQTTNYQVKFLDLTVPIYHLETYDWIVSMEVAEHIPKEFESIYVDNLVRHAREGIIMSWAVPGQGGLSHVNEQKFDYVKELFRSKGFKHLEQESIKMKQKSSLPWLRNNLNIFKRF
ncbi:unnamed protein product [Brachionus calyciflorus]|uniref:Uncharacterized protein n=1 Tax=Brachionus calyciflorus TaxID=104777 RepID=A0A814AG77_9BILA|nr:unnamed protein product [Brachionus calyciflorus]